MSQVLSYVTVAVWFLAAGAAAAEPESRDEIREAGLSTLFQLNLANRDAGALTGSFLKEFKLQSSGGFQMSEGKLTLHASGQQSFSALRPTPAGPVASWRVTLAAPEKDAKTAATTRLAFVLVNRQLAVLEIHRESDQGPPQTPTESSKSAGGDRIEFVLQSFDGKKQRLRVEKLTAGEAGGSWEFVYHHGDLRAYREGKLRGQSFAEINPNTASVAGVLLEQQLADVVLTSFELKGDAGAGVPPAPEQLESIREAQRANLRASQAFGAGNLDEAAQAAQEAVILWRKAKGDPSADAANAAFNLATVLKAKQDGPALRAAYQMVFDARRAVLGPAHPLTALAQLDLARAHADQNDAEAARPLAAAAAGVLEKSHGATHPSTLEAKRIAAP